MERLTTRVAGLVVCALGVLFYLGWEILYRGVYQYNVRLYAFDDADEWRYTACSRLVAHGYSLFTQVFSAQPPVLFLTLAAGMRLTSDSILGARWVEIAFGLLALIATAWLAARLAGWFAAGVAVLLLAVSPGFLAYSHAVEAEGPMMALATLALAVVVTPEEPVLWATVLAGLILAAAILTKLFAVAILAPALWWLWPRRSAVIAFLAAAVVPVVAEFFLVHPQAQWQQVVAMHNRAATLSLPGAVPAWHILANFFTLDLGLTLAAVVGLIALAPQLRIGVFFALWWLGQVAMLLLFRPLFPHHPAILLTAIACTAGVGTATALTARRWWLSAGAAVLYALLLVRLAHADRHLLLRWYSPPVTDLAAFVERNTPHSAMVATDDLEVADVAHRFVPPPLCDPSNVRLHAGYLTAQDLISATARYHAVMVLPTLGIYQQVPAYLVWVRRHYTPEPAPDRHTAYLRLPKK